MAPLPHSRVQRFRRTSGVPIMVFRDRSGLSRAQLLSLELEVGKLESLADVLRWGRSQPPGVVSPKVIADVVIQDEFTHDAVVPWHEGALVFGST